LAASVVPDLAILEAPFVDGSPIEDQDLAAAALEQQAKAAVAAADSLVHVHAPVISASAEAGLRGQASNVFPAYRAGVTITVPLWDGGLGAAQARAAEAGASALHAAADASSRARHSERLVARSDGARAEEKLRLAERLKKLAEEELGQVGERYRLGDVDLRVVLDARAHLSRAEGQVLAAKTERAQAALRARS
jgi:outer membrane protein TolC